MTNARTDYQSSGVLLIFQRYDANGHPAGAHPLRVAPEDVERVTEEQRAQGYERVTGKERGRCTAIR